MPEFQLAPEYLYRFTLGVIMEDNTWHEFDTFVASELGGWVEDPENDLIGQARTNYYETIRGNDANHGIVAIIVLAINEYTHADRGL